MNTPYGFDYGPIRVERVAYDERIGWVVTLRPLDGYSSVVTVRCSPAGKRWSVDVDGNVKVTQPERGTA